MTRTRRAAVAALGLGIAGLAFLPASAEATPQALSVQASVVDQECQGGDFVLVTLTANAESSSPVQYRWDFDNNGSFDTPASSSPQVTHLYLDETNVTAKVGARNTEGDKAKDRVSFATLDC